MDPADLSPQPLNVDAAPARRTAIGWQRECLAHDGLDDTVIATPCPLAQRLVSGLRSTEVTRRFGIDGADVHGDDTDGRGGDAAKRHRDGNDPEPRGCEADTESNRDVGLSL